MDSCIRSTGSVVIRRRERRCSTKKLWGFCVWNTIKDWWSTQTAFPAWNITRVLLCCITWCWAMQRCMILHHPRQHHVTGWSTTSQDGAPRHGMEHHITGWSTTSGDGAPRGEIQVYPTRRCTSWLNVTTPSPQDSRNQWWEDVYGNCSRDGINLFKRVWSYGRIPMGKKNEWRKWWRKGKIKQNVNPRLTSPPKTTW